MHDVEINDDQVMLVMGTVIRLLDSGVPKPVVEAILTECLYGVLGGFDCENGLVITLSPCGANTSIRVDVQQAGAEA